MKLMIRDLVSWSPLREPAEGYTVIVACMKSLASVAAANVQSIGRMNLVNMRELLLVFDCTTDEIPASVRAAAEALRPKVSVRLLGYTTKQVRVTRRISWGWVYSWLSWCRGIEAATTRHVLLHDLDAIPIDPDLFETIYADALASRGQYHGIRQRMDYPRTDTETLVSTFELVIDSEHLRRQFRPIDCFNQLCMIDGQVVDFDTFLHAQWRSPDRCVTPIDESQLVHPSQLICLYTDYVSGRSPMTHSHNLLVLPYFMYLGGEVEALTGIADVLSDADATHVPFAGRSLPVSGVEPEMWAWLEKQIRRVEHALHGRTRPPIEAYLAGMIPRSGERRSVGRENARSSVPTT